MSDIAAPRRLEAINWIARLMAERLQVKLLADHVKASPWTSINNATAPCRA